MARRRAHLTVSERMARVRSTGSKPELVVRRILSSLGVRYRLHRRDVPGTPDVFIARLNIAIFVNGCWWHGHHCRRGHREAKSNAEYWQRKIQRNVARDASTRENLAALGVRVVDLWECETARFQTACEAIASEYRAAEPGR